MSQQFGGAYGDLVAGPSFVQTPETVLPSPGQVALGRVAGTDASAVQLSGGQTIYPNSRGVVVVSVRDAAALKNAGWIEVSYIAASSPPTGQIPGGPLPISTLYSASAGWMPRAQTVVGILSLLSTAPPNTSVAGIAVSLIVNGNPAPIATGTTDAAGNFSLSTASLATHDPVAKTSLTVQAAGGAVGATSVLQ